MPHSVRFNHWTLASPRCLVFQCPTFSPLTLLHSFTCHPCQFTPLCFTSTLIPPEPLDCCPFPMDPGPRPIRYASKSTLSVSSAIPRPYFSTTFPLRSPRLQNSLLPRATAPYSMQEWYPLWTLRSPFVCIKQWMYSAFSRVGDSSSEGWGDRVHGNGGTYSTFFSFILSSVQ